ncbi:hypothetical protein HRbin30_02103 [bacterium HR30]|nr:hypothetical protein HRbin30_02103 [bacterium HR30]
MRLVPELPETVSGKREGITRRQVLRWGILGGSFALVPVSLPGCGDDGEPVLPEDGAGPTPFLDERELATLRALVEAVLPLDPGLEPLRDGVEQYVQRLLSDVPSAERPGAIFAGGPFSGRNPFPDYERGAASNVFPPNDFSQFVPLNRLQLLGWRARLLGSEAVPEFDFNASVLGPVTGLRNQYRSGLKELDDLSYASFGRSFSALEPAERQAVVQRASSDFIALVTGHALESFFSAPEYGGNLSALGWQAIGYDGDSQPLGYAIFDQSTNSYRERPGKPTTGPNPDETFSPFPPEIATLLRVLTRLAGSPRFP